MFFGNVCQEIKDANAIETQNKTIENGLIYGRNCMTDKNKTASPNFLPPCLTPTGHSHILATGLLLTPKRLLFPFLEIKSEPRG